MNADEKRRLKREVQMQSRALQRIGQWKNAAIAGSTIGAAFVYAGFIGGNNPVLGVLGTAVLLVGFIGAAVLNLGIRNGRRNVEKIKYVLDGERTDEV